MVLLLSSTAGSFCTSAHDTNISQERWINASSECFNCTPRQTCGAWHLRVSGFGYPAPSVSSCLAAGSPQLLSSWALEPGAASEPPLASARPVACPQPQCSCPDLTPTAPHSQGRGGCSAPRIKWLADVGIPHFTVHRHTTNTATDQNIHSVNSRTLPINRGQLPFLWKEPEPLQTPSHTKSWLSVPSQRHQMLRKSPARCKGRTEEKLSCV